MKTRKRTSIVLPLAIVAIASIALAPTSADAAPLKVDLGRSADPSQQSGWSEWNTDLAGVANISTTFAYADATDTTVDVTMTSAGNTYTRNYNNTITGAQAGNQNLLEDLVFFNSSLSGTNFIQVQFDDLKAGSYTYTGYHHFVQANTDFATTDILLNGVDTGDDVLMANHSSPYLIDTLRTSVVNFAVASDNDPVTIRYANPTGTTTTFGLNGFELTQIPEPATMSLLALGGLAILRRRKRA